MHGPGRHHHGGPGFGGHHHHPMGHHRPPMGHHHPPMGGWHHRPMWHRPHYHGGCCGCLFPVIGLIVAFVMIILLIV